jgi:multicomponent Na+:H+ antiporter subunit C
LSSVTIYLVSGLVVFVVCLYGAVVRAHLMRKILALNMMGTAVFIVLTAVASRGEVVDPVPQAMVLTGIVVAVSATAFALAALRRLVESGGEPYLPEDLGYDPDDESVEAAEEESAVELGEGR